MIKNVLYFFPTFPHFFVTAALTTSFERCFLSPENSLFALKLCLLSSGMFEWFKSSGRSTRIRKIVVLACFEDFACLPCCRDDKDVTTYEGPQKFNSFRTYFNQVY